MVSSRGWCNSATDQVKEIDEKPLKVEAAHATAKKLEEMQNAWTVDERER